MEQVALSGGQSGSECVEYSETTDTDMEYLKNNFDPFKYVPTFYYIKKNKVIDYLVISDWNNPIKELDNWIQNVE